MTPTLSVEAFQARASEVAVVTEWPKPVGTDGAVVSPAGGGGGGGGSGGGVGALTVTVVEALAEPPLPLQVKLKIAVVVRLPVLWEPEIALAPLQAPEAVQDVALVEDQDRLEALPEVTAVGLAEIETVGVDEGGGGGGVGGGGVGLARVRRLYHVW